MGLKSLNERHDERTPAMKMPLSRAHLWAILLTGLPVLVGILFWLISHNTMQAYFSTGQDLAPYTDIAWENLIPADQTRISHVNNSLANTDLSQLKDADPRAQALLQEMREQMEQALPVTSLDGDKIRIRGYLVPLEYDDTHRIKEFLLVPYFGACIHTPPPPPNQIIHVFLSNTTDGEFSLLDQVEITGEMEVRASDSDMGRSAYSMWADELVKVAVPEEGSVR